MNAKEILKKIEELHYWDSRVIHISSNYFTDEIILKYDDSSLQEKAEVTYIFYGCYKSNFFHWLGFEKDRPYKELTKGQIPYFIQDIEVSDFEEEVTVNQNKKEIRKLLICKILMPPMEVEIWCKDIEVNRVVIEEE